MKKGIFTYAISFVSLSSAIPPTETYSLCLTGYYCNGDDVGVRGEFETPDACLAACQTLDVQNSETYSFFDLSTDGQKSCWCGSSCSVGVSYQTNSYAIGNAICISHAPTDAPTQAPTTQQPSAAPTTIAPSDSPTVAPTTTTPSAAPTPSFSLCSEGLYCKEDSMATRNLHGSPMS